MTRRRLIALAALLLGLSALPLAGRSDQRQAQLRLLVKLRPTLARKVESALPLNRMSLTPFESGDQAVESFLSRHAVRRISPLYPAIVTLKKTQGISDLEIAMNTRRKFAKRGARLHADFQPPEISRTYVLELPGDYRSKITELLQALRADGEVEFAEEDKQVHASFTPNDPYFLSSGSWGQPYDDLWGIKKINAPAAWDSATGAGILVAVVDTGIDYNHPDLAANIWPSRGHDFIGSSYLEPQESNDPIDHQGHGTHVAGIIAAAGSNAVGVIGVAWHSQVMAVKGLDDTGTGLDSTLALALKYAADNGADVINASWGSPEYSQTIADAVSYAYNLGIVVVAAAGNNGQDARNFYPAGLSNVITVAASDHNDQLASFSNFGSKIDVAAPGVDILSLQASGTNLGTPVSPGYTRASGTSMAAPHVSGLAALILSHNGNYSNEEVRQVLRVSAADLGAAGYDFTYGYGRISASTALGVTGALEVKITSPVDGTVTQGLLTISGLAGGAGFSHYVLEDGAGSLPTSWTTIQTSSAPVSGTLGTFDTTSLADGVYTIRLTAFNSASQAFVDRIQIVVHTVYILAPVPPPAPTSSTTFKNGAVISISGTAVGAGFQNFRVEWAPGLDPSSGWQTTGITLTGQGLAPISSGLLAKWDSSGITGAGYYTIRLTANKSGSSPQALTMVYLEPALLSTNFPQLLDQGSYFSAGAVPATNPDGTTRLVVEGPANGPGFGEFWTVTSNTAPLQSLLLGSGCFQQPAVADLDGSPGEQAAVADSTGIEVVRADGTSYPLSTTTNLDYQRSQILIEDLAGDSHWETLALGSDYSNQVAYISAWRADGSELNNNFPIQIADQNPLNTWYNRTRILAADVDGDGKKEIVAQEGVSPTAFTLRLFKNDGTPRTWGVPTFTGIAEAMAAADLDRNGKLETILVLYTGPSNDQAIVHVFQPDGTERPGWPVTLPNPDQNSQSFLTVGDLNRDGHYEIVYSHEASLYVFRDNGTVFSSAWPLSAGSSASPGFASVVIGDVDGDGFPEIVTTLDTTASTSDPFFTNGAQYGNQELVALRRDATISKRWKLNAGNGYILYHYPAPAIGDFNQDGITDIAVAYEVFGAATAVPGVVTVLSTGAKYNPALNDWPLIHQNGRNSNVLQNVVASTSSTLTALASSANPSVTAQSVTFTASVAALSAGANLPTGQVIFLDGSTSIGSCTLTTGKCSLTTAALAAGTHAMSAQFLGDAHSTVSVSQNLAQVVSAADFSLSATGPESVNAGASASYTITVAPNPSPFDFAVGNFTCAGLPSGAACHFSTSSVMPGANPATVVLSISTTARTQAALVPGIFAERFSSTAWLLAGVLCLFAIQLASTRRRGRVMVFAGLFMAVCLVVGSCGGGAMSNPPPIAGTPAGTYTVTVSATGNTNISHSVTVLLTVN